MKGKREGERGKEDEREGRKIGRSNHDDDYRKV